MDGSGALPKIRDENLFWIDGTRVHKKYNDLSCFMIGLALSYIEKISWHVSKQSFYKERIFAL